MLGVVRLAAFVIVIWSIVLQSLVGVVIPPVLAVGIVFATLLPFLRPGRRWVGPVAGILGLTSVLGNLPSLVEELSHPSSALAFILTLVATTAALALTVAGAAVFLGWSARPGILSWIWAGVVAIGFVAALVAASEVDSVPPVQGDVTVVAKANRYVPEQIALPTGGAGIWIDNRDGARHTFTVPDLGLSVELVGLKSQRVEIDAPAGEYNVFCTVVGHEGMTATVVVG